MDQKEHGSIVGQAWREGPIGTARPDQRTFSDDVIAQRQFLVRAIDEHSRSPVVFDGKARLRMQEDPVIDVLG